MTPVGLDVDKHIVAAVDATERSLDSLELAKLLSRTIGAPVDIVTVFPYVRLPGRLVHSSVSSASSN